ncbi:MAG: PEP-CTERM sorting domain-containing protein [Phenylobacterium sp.]|uniref:FxDxF family PEP-CTERM protein n=1 Tax=Phenylobacterium sp. TaxID=1871053 RepID=UPI0025E838C6|nr:FxDxF family PEP-CTERM protein [Phenylobacterium sp.]MBI1197549.1 PEP-CTERM sorting domain-containing protein [Phenylobacterium sp.]
MTRIVLATACAAALMAGSAEAGTYLNLTTDPGTGAISGHYGNDGIGEGPFVDTFDLSLPDGLSSFTVNSIFSPGADVDWNNIDFTSVTFNGEEFDVGLTGDEEFRYLHGVNIDGGSAQVIRVAGTSGGNGSYDGIITFTPTGAVPEPAAWALMIAGFSGAGVMLRRRRQALA